MLVTNFESKDNMDKLWSTVKKAIDPLQCSGLPIIKIKKREKKKDRCLFIGQTTRGGETLKFSLLIYDDSTIRHFSIRRCLGDYFLFNMWMRKFIEVLNKSVSITKS